MIKKKRKQKKRETKTKMNKSKVKKRNALAGVQLRSSSNLSSSAT